MHVAGLAVELDQLGVELGAHGAHGVSVEVSMAVKTGRR
jgi:hypothetical protein